MVSWSFEPLDLGSYRRDKKKNSLGTGQLVQLSSARDLDPSERSVRREGRTDHRLTETAAVTLQGPQCQCESRDYSSMDSWLHASQRNAGPPLSYFPGASVSLLSKD